MNDTPKFDPALVNWNDPIEAELMLGAPLPKGAYKLKSGDPRSMHIMRKAHNAARGRKRLAGRFFNDVLALWETEGEACLRRAIHSDPMAFANMVAKLMPQKIEVSDTTLEDVDDDQLGTFIDAIQRRLEQRAERAKLVGGTGSDAPLTIEARAEPAHGGEPPALLPPLR